MLTGCVVSQSSAEASERPPPTRESGWDLEQRTDTVPEKTRSVMIIETERKKTEKEMMMMMFSNEKQL